MPVFSKRSLEGVVLIDHRDSPGITPQFAQANKVKGPVVGKNTTYESAFVVCHSCCRDVVLNPNRSRERAYCWAHDAYLCDECGAAQKAGAVCISYSQRLAQAYEKIIRGLTVTTL